MAEKTRYPRPSTLKTAEDFRAHAGALGIHLPCDDTILAAARSPLARSLSVGGFEVGNRFAIQPMEGWDGTTEGMPTDTVRRRWRNFGLSGAKLIWGGEAFAVCPEGRANPHQLMVREETAAGVAQLREILVAAHLERCGSADDLLVGLQLTHSGRFCRPFRKDRMEPQIVYRHPILDRKFGIAEDHPQITDEYLSQLIELYVKGARIAQRCGYQFVDVKHCHGYLGHELLSGYTREGSKYGGSFESRSRFCREVIAGIRAEAPALMIGVRLSAFDALPFRPDPEAADGKRLGPGIPEPFDSAVPYRYGFGLDPQDPLKIELAETFEFIDMLNELGVDLINVTCGSPYYNPHIQRPALFPPSDGYQPPEDPLVGVARQLNVVAQIKERFPQTAVVGSGYSYLQEFLPHVAQQYVRQGSVDFVGLGRMVLSYPELPFDLLQDGKMERKKICRTFSDCTTAPRNGMISGCFPLDPFYKKSDEAEQLKKIKAAAD
jgi:NADPH2 dehydrogenase